MGIRSVVAVVLLSALTGLAQAEVRIKELVRIDGPIDSQLLGYGLVVGLAGTGDTERNLATVQSVSNILREFGIQVPVMGIRSRNVAAVLVTATVASSLRAGDRFDVVVSAMGDARSLSGGTLIVTPLLGPDREQYGTAQGAVSANSFSFEQNGSLAQKNHPTSGLVTDGGLARQAIRPELLAGADGIDLRLLDPDFTTAARIAAAINEQQPELRAVAEESGRVHLHASDTSSSGLARVMAMIEGVSVDPDLRARVVVNERTGTVVAGGNVSISAVTVAQGDIRVAISKRYQISQPSGWGYRTSPGVRTAVVPESTVVVREDEPRAVSLEQGATVAELVAALRTVRASSQDIVAVLQGLKRAGALHADLVVQ